MYRRRRGRTGKKKYRRRTYAFKKRHTYAKNYSRIGATSTKRKAKLIKKTPIFYIPRLINEKNYKFIRTTNTREYTYTQAALVTSKGIIVEDYTWQNMMNTRVLTDMVNQYRDFAIISCVTTIYLSELQKGVENMTSSATLGQTMDWYMKPHILIAHCNDGDTQNGLSLLTNDATNVQEFWNAYPYTKRLNQRNKGVWKFFMPKALQSFSTGGLVAANKVGDSFPNTDPRYFHHPHGFVACVRNITDISAEAKFKLVARLDACLLFRIKRPTV